MGSRGRWISEFVAILVYRANSRIARDREALSILKKKKSPSVLTSPVPRAELGFHLASCQEVFPWSAYGRQDPGTL